MDLLSSNQLALLQSRPLTDDQVRLIREYLDELYDRNKVSNLTRVPMDQADVRHVADSMLISEFCQEGSSVLDIGCGPGFPSWILAAYRPDLRVTAIESQGKMVRMLTAISLPNLEVKNQRAEVDVERNAFDVVTGRAVAPFSTQFELSAAWVRIGGFFIPFRTPVERDEIERFPALKLGFELKRLEERSIPESDTVRLFPVFKKIKPTPSEFPRGWGRMKSHPLK